jgi:hypothetical protein
MTDTVFAAPLVTLYPTSSAFGRPIKAFFNGEIRRFTFVGTSFHELMYELAHLGIPTQNSTICYQDDEGDWVTVTSDMELFHAFELFGNKPVRLDIRLKGTPAIAPSVAQNSPAVILNKGDLKTPPLVLKKDDIKILKKHAKFDEKLAKRELKQDKRESKLAQKELKKDVKHYVMEHIKEPRLIARFVKHVTVEDNYEFLPGTVFTKTWCLRNEGSIPWPANCALLFVGKKGDQMGAPDSVTLNRAVLSGEEVHVSVQMTAPANGGTYFGYWRLAEPSGKKFGQRVRVLIKVIDSSSSSSEEKDKETSEVSWGELLTQLESMGFKDKALNVRFLVRSHGDMDRVIRKLLHREEKRSGVKRGNN